MSNSISVELTSSHRICTLEYKSRNFDKYVFQFRLLAVKILLQYSTGLLAIHGSIYVPDFQKPKSLNYAKIANSN
jgi:hypothetical protein